MADRGYLDKAVEAAWESMLGDGWNPLADLKPDLARAFRAAEPLIREQVRMELRKELLSDEAKRAAADAYEDGVQPGDEYFGDRGEIEYMAEKVLRAAVAQLDEEQQP